MEDTVVSQSYLPIHTGKEVMRIRDIPAVYNIKGRPSKTYFHYLFDRDVGLMSHCPVTADIASDDFQNADLFRSDEYIGVDIRQSPLVTGWKQFSGQSHSTIYHGIRGDMRDTILRPNTVDLLTSTHTLGHIPSEDHHLAIKNFCGYVKPEGHMFLQMRREHYTEEIRETLHEEFKTVEVVEYRTPLSQWYERAMAEHGDDQTVGFLDNRGLNRIVNLLLAVLILLLTAIEMTGLLPGNYVYVRGLRKQ